MSYPDDLPDARLYRSYQDMADAQEIDVDYRIIIDDKPSSAIAIVAPHAGKIESYTSDVAKAIARDTFGLYLLEGLRDNYNFETLHLSSHYFDEPRCLQFISKKRTVITIHGCNGKQPLIYLGGRHLELKQFIADALRTDGFKVETDQHKYMGTHPDNICNRGSGKMGLQIELSDGIRLSNLKDKFAETVRCCLKEIDHGRFSIPS